MGPLVPRHRVRHHVDPALTHLLEALAVIRAQQECINPIQTLAVVLSVLVASSVMLMHYVAYV